MKFPRNRESATVEETADTFYDFTRRLLMSATAQRDERLLRRAAIRVDSARFSALSDTRQEDLLELYAGAMMACGALSP